MPDGRHVQRRERLAFVTGCSHIVVGLETGIQRLRVGGVRRVVVPPRVGYGTQPPWGVDVPPHSILVFVIDEVRVLGRRLCHARL